jgi:hypothetical protein
MRRSIAVVADTQLLPGTRVRWAHQHLTGRVLDISLHFDGENLTFDGCTVRWDYKPSSVRPIDDSFCRDELHMLEILP